MTNSNMSVLKEGKLRADVVGSLIDVETGRLGHVGTDTLDLRLATTPADIEAALNLRYRVFYEEMDAQPTPEMLARQQDFDKYDDVCDHLLVINKQEKDFAKSVVGTYRLIRRQAAEKVGGFYSTGEFDITKIVDTPREVLELGRSAVEAPFRTRPTMQLLWRGIAAYMMHHNVELLFGCASLHGIDVEQIKLPLSYLYHYHLAPPALRARALPEVYQEMNLMAAEDIDVKKALAEVPALIKGYLRVGSTIGEGAFIDYQFDTTDVFVVMHTENIASRYFDKYLSKYEH